MAGGNEANTEESYSKMCENILHRALVVRQTLRYFGLASAT
jgi:hypothetical protein